VNFDTPVTRFKNFVSNLFKEKKFEEQMVRYGSATPVPFQECSPY
jgi:hypothetical protein